MTTVQLTGNDVQKFLDMAINQFNIQVKIIDNIKMPNLSKRKKGKWALVAEKMQGTLNPEDVEYLQKCSNEIREGFELRNIEISK
jgi:hypothetical protein